MTPKEKSEELYNIYFKFCNELSHDKNKTLAKLMSLACVDEILDSSIGFFDDNSDYVNYWQQVKKEIKKTA